MQKSKRFTAHSLRKRKYYAIYIAKNMTIIWHSCIISIEIQKVFNSEMEKKPFLLMFAIVEPIKLWSNQRKIISNTVSQIH